MINSQIKLRQELTVFHQPDTSTAPAGRIGAATYPLIDTEVVRGARVDEYALLRHEELGEVWICMKSGNETYADIIKQPISNFDNDSMAVDESVLKDLLPAFEEFTYNYKSAFYPFSLPGVNIQLAPPNPSTNNCCTFVEGIVVKAWETAIDGFTWSKDKHNKMMINDAADLFSPVTCLIDSGMALAVDDPDALPARWTVVQGWRDAVAVKGGHTFIILDYHEESDKVLTLESNKAFGLDGVGFRAMGNFKYVRYPKGDWWSKPGLWTWDRVKATYKDRAQCVLKVKNTSWVSPDETHV